MPRANLSHHSDLTARQAEIVQLAKAGHNMPKIAALLGLSRKTVVNYKVEAMKRLLSRESEPIDRLKLLSPRQRQVVRLASLGCSSKEIGLILGIATKTAQTARERAMQVLGATTTPMVTRLAIQYGITTFDDKLTAAEKRKSGRHNDGWN
jgi:DNA-binding CsgD family transcriptional regulator